MAGGSSVPIGFGTPPKVTVIRQERINQVNGNISISSQ
jgi:hypothetical protein